MHALPEFTSIHDCPANRDRLDAWYRKVLPLLTQTPTTWSRLRGRGEAVKRQWRAYWKQRDGMQSSDIIPIRTTSE